MDAWSLRYRSSAGPGRIACVIGPDPHHTIAVADTTNGRIVARFSPGKGDIGSLAASPDGGTIYFGAGDGVTEDPSSHELVISRFESSRIVLFRVSPDGGSEQSVPLDSSAASSDTC